MEVETQQHFPGVEKRLWLRETTKAASQTTSQHRPTIHVVSAAQHRMPNSAHVPHSLSVTSFLRYSHLLFADTY